MFHNDNFQIELFGNETCKIHEPEKWNNIRLETFKIQQLFLTESIQN